MTVPPSDQPPWLVIDDHLENEHRAAPAEKWKVADIQKVLEMWEKRDTYQDIATAVNRTVHGVKGCLQKLRKEGKL